MLAALGLALALASPSPSPSRGVASVRRYFAAWNERDMALAADQFAEGCTYDDTQYNEPFTGKEALVRHLLRVADALPPSFQFCIDEVADGGDTIGVQWHVENSGVPLPFTRGCSMYKADAEGKLVSGFDVPEPAPFKPGSASLLLLSVASKLIQEPARAVPLAAWLGYVTIVFFSNGILPGPDATQLDGATWVEVRDLSLNFWLVAPLLNLPFAPTVHPGLEAIFNWLLAWAAAFGGFLSDGRPGRSAGTTSNSMLPVLAGMQFLTNAVLLPYLVTRPASPDTLTYVEDIGAAATIGESKPLGPILAAVGTSAIGWGLLARPEFGDLSARWHSLCDLLSHDRRANFPARPPCTRMFRRPIHTMQGRLTKSCSLAGLAAASSSTWCCSLSSRGGSSTMISAGEASIRIELVR